MSPELVELLLRKQRLQLAAADQRRGCMALIEHVEAGMNTLTRLQVGLQGLGQTLRAHAPPLVLAGLVVLTWRPRGVLRWAQRGWLLYLGTRRLRSIAGAALAAAGKLRGEIRAHPAATPDQDPTPD